MVHTSQELLETRWGPLDLAIMSGRAGFINAHATTVLNALAHDTFYLSRASHAG